jgi:hypothetical protein
MARASLVRATSVAVLSVGVCILTWWTTRDLAPTPIVHAHLTQDSPHPAPSPSLPRQSPSSASQDIEEGSPRGDEPFDGPLLANQLEPLLTNLGYEPRQDVDAWILTIEREDWIYSLRAALYYNNRFLWIWGYLGELDEQKLSSGALVRLLETNNDIGPTHFFVGPTEDGKKALYIGRALDNRGLRPSIIRREVDAVCGAMRKTREIWESITSADYPAEAPRNPPAATSGE